MKKVTIWYLLFSCIALHAAHDNNLIILLDPLKRETISTDDVSITHQLLMALHQKSSVIIVSSSLVANYRARVARFKQGLQSSSTLESSIMQLYQAVNRLLRQNSISAVNHTCSASWLQKIVPVYADLESDDRKMLDFNFFCYLFAVDENFWQEQRVSSDLTVFTPRLQADHQLTKKSGSLVKKMSDIIDELHLRQDLAVYIAGHGQQEKDESKSRVAGLTIADFLSFVQFLHEKTTTKLLAYLSCYVGGYLSKRAYELPNKEQIKLRFPVLVISAGPYAVYPHGVLSGVVLPAYRTNHELNAACAGSSGLKIKESQQFAQFFKLVHQGAITPYLAYLLDPNSMCEKPTCAPALYENLAQIRLPYATSFVPFITQDNLCVVSQRNCTTSDQAVLLDHHTTEKIVVRSGMKIMPMGSHQEYKINVVDAPELSRKQFLTKSCITFQDAEPQSLQIQKAVLQDGLLLDIYIFYNPKTLPRFITEECDKLVCYQRNGKRYFIGYNQDRRVQSYELGSKHYQELLRWLRKKRS